MFDCTTCIRNDSHGGEEVKQRPFSAYHSPSSWGNSSHTIAVDVLNPASIDTVKEAPIARPSIKLCSASPRVIIHATVLMLVMRCPRSQWHTSPDIWTSCKSDGTVLKAACCCSIMLEKSRRQTVMCGFSELQR